MNQEKYKDQTAAETFLNQSLPDDAREIQFFYIKPGDDQDLYWAFLKFECSAQSYHDFITKLGLKTRTEQLTPHLPAAWSLPSHIKLEWWDPAPSDTEDSAAKSISNAGWIVTKYEGHKTYLYTTGVATE